VARKNQCSNSYPYSLYPPKLFFLSSYSDYVFLQIKKDRCLDFYQVIYCLSFASYFKVRTQ
jgi:hypothetical protein